MLKRKSSTAINSNVFIVGIALAVIALIGVKYWTKQQAISKGVTQHDPVELARHSVITSIARAGERLVAVGEKGIVLVSDDAGQHWRLVDSGQRFTLSAVGFNDDQRGVAAGHQGTLLTTSDGGQTWQAMSTRNQVDGQGEGNDLAYAPPLLNVEVEGDGAFLATGAFGDVRQSLDRGKTWTVVTGVHAAGDERHLYGSYRSSGATWFAGELGTLMVQHGDGEPIMALPSPYNGTLFGVLVDRAGTLLTYGMGGAVHASKDKGLTWEPCSIPTEAPIVAGLNAWSGETLLADMTGRLFAATPGDCRFTALAPRYMGQLADMVQVDESSLLVVGSRGISGRLKFR